MPADEATSNDSRRPFRLCLLLAAFLCCSNSSLYAKSELEALDDRIVKAYNSEPKRTAEVYALCLDMIDLANSKGGESSSAWIEKSRKLLTLACLNEAVEAQRRADWRQVYIWCARASVNGTSKGEMGGLDLAKVASFLSNLQANAKKAMDENGESYGNLSLFLRPESRTDARRPLPSSPSAAPLPEGASAIDVQNAGLQPKSSPVQGRLRAGEGPLIILDGPKQDKDRGLFIKIKTPAGREATIVFLPGKGWYDESRNFPVYYESWKLCADAVDRGEMR